MSELSSHEQIDLKLKDLIQLSKRHNEPKRAAVVFYLLIRKELNKKGILLGFAPLISKQERRSYEYMNMINAVMEKNFKFQLFDKEMVGKVQKYEMLYLKGPSFVSFDSLKELINIYYELRQLDVPNMYKLPDELNESNLSFAMNANKRFSFNQMKKRNSILRKQEQDQVRQYLSLDVRQKERLMETRLKKGYDKKDFEQLLRIRRLKKEIKEGNSSKILFNGKLKENFFYKQEVEQAPAYFLIGFAMLFIMMALVLFIQDFMLPEIGGAFSIISFALFGGAFFLIIIYWKLFYQER